MSQAINYSGGKKMVYSKKMAFVDKTNDWLGRMLSVGVLIMFLLVISEVVLRYFFNAPTVWGNELTQYTFGIYAVLSGGYLLRCKAHVNVDIFYSRFSPRGKAILDFINFPLFLLFCGILLIYGGSLAWESLRILEHSGSAWNPPIYPVKLMIPIGAILLFAQGITKLSRDIVTAVTGLSTSEMRSEKKETI